MVKINCFQNVPNKNMGQNTFVGKKSYQNTELIKNIWIGDF